ncbi:MULTISPECIES: hypothetical protein [Vibrio]|uniref:hypothetical protein n=1 Tax=Vibrio sp. 10N.261.52.E6 TaxID=3229682 RepID=UPI000C81E6A2|nr:hypothetical protein [Vibrio cyclitrophicus]PMJ40005.1 hypothetical protein BCU22_13605 [Vibrio cyclitrophicus]
MYSKSNLCRSRFVLFSIALLLTLSPFLAKSDDGTFTKTVYSSGKNSLVEKYDVFSEDNKKYTLKLGESNGYKSLTFTKSQNSNYITVYSSSMTKGDGRYSKPRSGKIELKFDNDDKVYDLGGTSYYLRYTTTSVYKDRNAELIEKLASKNYMYVKVNVVGQDYVFKVGLQGTGKMLSAGTFM